MARTVLKNKSVLIAGAETPAGRAAALQFSREGALVILGAASLKRVTPLEESILNKGGAAIAALIRHGERLIPDLLEARALAGNHFHYIVNVLAAAPQDPAEPEIHRERAVKMNEALLEIIRGKGAVRAATLWPEEIPPPGDQFPGGWHCLARFGEIQRASDDPESDDQLRAAAVGDSLLYLMNCPPGACPTEVRLEKRQEKF